MYDGKDFGDARMLSRRLDESLEFPRWIQASAAVCPFCTAAGQTLRQEMESMDVVAIATLVPTTR